MENVGGIGFITLGRVSSGGLAAEVIFRGKWEGMGISSGERTIQAVGAAGAKFLWQECGVSNSENSSSI